jgi:RNA polymerase sigma-70 factor (ECF subfamily)
MRGKISNLVLVQGRALGPARLQSLYLSHRPALLQYLTRILSSREDAEEIAQDTYLRLMRVPELVHFEGEAARRFIFKTALNLARDRFRSQRVRAHDAHVPYDSLELVSDEPTADEIVDRDAGIEVVKDVLLSLPPRHRRTFLLHMIENLSYRKIALCLGVSTKTVERDLAVVFELVQSRLRVREQP